MGAAVLCASFMSFGVKRRWFALGAALQLAISTYAAYVGGYVHYGDWLKVRPSSPFPGGWQGWEHLPPYVPVSSRFGNCCCCCLWWLFRLPD